MSRHRVSQAGFTLVELLVVIFILSLFATIVTPQVMGFLERKRLSEPEKLLVLLSDLKDEAILKGTKEKIKFDFKKKRVTFGQGKRQRSINVKTLTSVYLPSRGTVREGELILFFSEEVYPEPFLLNFKSGKCIVYNPFSGDFTLSSGCKDRGVQPS